MRCYLIIFLSLICPLSFAELRIEVTKGVDKRVQVAVVPFDWRGKGRLPENISEIVDSDLRLSGRFETTDTQQMLSFPSSVKEVFYRDWKLLKVEYLLIGHIKPEGDALRVHYELYNIPKQSIEVSESVVGNPDEIRDLAHHVSDVVFERLTGIEGAFSTRIMYVTAIGPLQNRLFRLNIADADGHRVKTVLETREPMLSPTWAPDGNRIAYVSFERDSKPAIYVQDLSTHSRIEVSRFEGLNSAPAFSPDGKQLALVLSKTGNPDIWIYDLESRTFRQLTRHYGIDTEPSWSADGQSIIFTSSRGGKPQIYKIQLQNLKIERLTFEGDYNAGARLLPDGSGLVMVHRRDGNFYISFLDLRRGTLSVLTETTLDESPSIAPNGSMLIYATLFRDQGILAAVSIDGGIKFNLPSSVGDVREPAWSPKKRKVFTPISE